MTEGAWFDKLTMTKCHPEPVEGREERLSKTRLTSLSRILLERVLTADDQMTQGRTVRAIPTRTMM